MHKDTKKEQKEGKKCINTDKYTEWVHKDTKKQQKDKNTDKIWKKMNKYTLMNK